MACRCTALDFARANARGIDVSEEPQYEVVWPLGRSTTRAVAPNTRGADPQRLKVGFVWDYLFKGDQMFATIGQALRHRFPGVELVDYSAFGNIHGHDERAVVAALPERLRSEGVDAVIVGVGA